MGVLAAGAARLAASRRGLGRSALGLVAAIAALGAAVRGTGTAYADAAISHYTKALRGAVRPRRMELVSPGFRRLASISYEAIQLRRERNFGRASKVYQRSIAMQVEGQLLSAEEVPAAVAAAHTSLNLALTEKALGRLNEAQKAFRRGCAMVQELMFRDLGAWVDGHHRINWRGGSSPGQKEREVLDEVLRWIATLLTAWALLEMQRGKAEAARLLIQRAARFDSEKESVLRWQALRK